MKRLSMLFALILTIGGGFAVAQEEWPTNGGVDRASAAGKPNEAGALPESSEHEGRLTPDGAQESGSTASTASTAEPDAVADQTPEPAAEPAAEPSARALPATASPLASLTVSGLIFLATAGGLYHLRREQQH